MFEFIIKIIFQIILARELICKGIFPACKRAFQCLEKLFQVIFIFSRFWRGVSFVARRKNIRQRAMSVHPACLGHQHH